MSRSKAARISKAEDGWRAVQWEDLEAWAGKTTVERGEAYRGEKRVERLAVTEDGGLLATVAGNDDYATHVWLEGERRPESMCSCPVGHACKHAVATILEYLHALAEKRDVPVAAADDPRWHDLDEPFGEGVDDERLFALIEGMSRTELIDALQALVNMVPEAGETLRDIIGPDRG